jgi:hypothetical protein
MQRVRFASSVLVALAGVSGASTAVAHIDLLEPEARAHGTAARGDPEIDVNSSLKNGPCGQVTTGRTERVATYAPGQRITVRVREENAHVGYLRVSLDLDGQEFPLRAQAPAEPETQEVAEAAEAALGGDGLLAVVRENNDTPGFIHELDVTLPDVSCNNCTLQVLQFMYDDLAAPFYFQCADLVLTAGDGGEDAGGSPGAGSSGTSSGPGGAGDVGTTVPPAAGNGASPEVNRGTAPGEMTTGGAPQETTTPARGSGAPGNAAPGSGAVTSPDGDAGGCNLSHRAQGAGFSLSFGLWALGLALFAARVAHPARSRGPG